MPELSAEQIKEQFKALPNNAKSKLVDIAASIYSKYFVDSKVNIIILGQIRDALFNAVIVKNYDDVWQKETQYALEMAKTIKDNLLDDPSIETIFEGENIVKKDLFILKSKSAFETKYPGFVELLANKSFIKLVANKDFRNLHENIKKLDKLIQNLDVEKTSSVPEITESLNVLSMLNVSPSRKNSQETEWKDKVTDSYSNSADKSFSFTLP